MRTHRFVKRAIRRSLQKYKHQVDNGAVAVNMAAAVTTNVIVVGLDNPVIANATNVQARGKVLALYMELTCQNFFANGIQVFDWCLQYSPQSGIGAVDPTLVGTNTGKNYVFKSGNLSVAQFQTGKSFGLIKIPSKYSRFMNTDVIYFNIRSRVNNGATDAYQVKFIYKEIRG